MTDETLSRRSIVAAMAATTALAGLPCAALAHGPTIQLQATTREIEIAGKLVKRLAIKGPQGMDGLRLRKGDDFRVRLTNTLAEETLVHWHGLILPPSQDGVPGISAPAIPPGGYADYDFPLVQAGTYWMHSHVGFQEQLGLAMPLILEDPEDPLRDLQEVVLFLEDFTFKDPYEILKTLKLGGMMAMEHDHEPTMKGHSHTIAESTRMAAERMQKMGMKMDPSTPDLNDVDYDAYLANSRTLQDPEIVQVESNAKVRVRIINGSASTNYLISAGGRTARLIAVDGEPVEPIDDTVFPIAIAQRLDLLVDVPAGAAVPVLAQREGDTSQTGLILAAPRAAVAKIADNAEKAAGAVGVELEARLQTKVPLPPRPISNELDSILSGNMQRYIWMMDGGPYPKNKPLVVTTGQRTAVRIRNETGMSHPMHLHGHVFQVIEIGGLPLDGAVRDTVLVPPMTNIMIAFDADNPGIWAYHCHNLYHLEAGMFSYVAYVPAT